MSEAIVPKGQPTPGDPEKKGWLFKWTNYLKGYQRRWFVLSNGLLSYYRNQAEMAHTCRGTISLLGALIHTADSCTFVISNGGTQTFHIRAHDEVERQSWVTALELAKAKAIRAQESDDDEDQMSGGADVYAEGEAEDAGGIARELAARFHDLRTCSELVARHGGALQRSLVDLEIPPSDTTKQVSERATLFRISCNAMMNACSEFMSAAAASSARMSRALQHERDQKMRLQEAVEQLARQHDNLEKAVTHRTCGNGTGQGNASEDEDHEFFDAMEDGASSTDEKAHNSFVMKVPDKNLHVVKCACPPSPLALAGNGSLPEATPSKVNRTTTAQKSGESSDESDPELVTETQQVYFVEERPESSMGAVDSATSAGKPPADSKSMDVVVWPHVSQVVSMVDGHPRRTRVPDKPNYPLSLWSIMKNCIGKELSKIPIPVNFSEPLSMLQRLAEDYEYSGILDEAARFTDPAQQLAYVAAFTVSAYATTANRTNKPFNPLLGETYECDRMSDLGWRCISEQVSHHPPMVAQHCEGAAGWQCWQEFTMTTKFRGKYLQVIPLGAAAACFPSQGNKYTWRKVIHYPPTAAMHVQGGEWTSAMDHSMSSMIHGATIVLKPRRSRWLRYRGSGNEYLWRQNVSHHPPISAGYCMSRSWSVLVNNSFKSKFRGQVINVSPRGFKTINFRGGNKYYNCPKVTTTVHNIIVGKLWVDNHGDMDIIGEGGAAAGYVAHLKYQPYGYFSKDTQRKVTGVIKDPSGVPRYVLQGYWDSRVEVAPVTSASPDNTVCKTGKFTVAWQRVDAPPDSDKWYNFTLLAAQLNEPEPGVAPTDSRRRPDQRLMEEGLWDEANKEKLRLEEKQRAKRRELEAAAEAAAAAGQAAPPSPAPAPLWFSRAAAAPGEPQLRHLYNDTYWQCKQKQEWNNCPDIF